MNHARMARAMVQHEIGCLRTAGGGASASPPTVSVPTIAAAFKLTEGEWGFYERRSALYQHLRNALTAAFNNGEIVKIADPHDGSTMRDGHWLVFALSTHVYPSQQIEAR